jgi:PAS domain S-box-containing protein
MATTPIRILLIDDDEDDYCLTRELLGEMTSGGFELDWVPEYEAALEAICRGTYDVCLLDYRLGPRTGLDLLREARQQGCSLPVILLTGQSEREIDFAAMEAGAADYLEKAKLSASQLDRAIRYTLLQKRHADELEKKVEARTSELAAANTALQAEIATRRLTEDALRESEVRFRHLADAMPQFVWVIAADGTLDYINRQWTEYTGLTLEQTRQRELVRQVIHPQDIAAINASAERARQQGTAYKIEFRLKRASDGAYRWFLGRGVPVKNEEREIIKWYGTSTDIDDQKRVEERQREEARRKDEFLASMAHELRNPLAPIRNALEIMRLAGDNLAALHKGRAMIERQVTHLVRLIDDLLDVSRISRGKIRLRVEKVDVAQVVHAAVETSRPLIDASQHHLTISLPAKPVVVEGDPTRLAQVLLNLLNNAAKYTDPGGKISVMAAQEGEEAVFRVRDNGIGITPEILPHIFGMFTQAGRSEDRSQGGLGIGLALARGLVQLHGGTIEAHSEGSGRGSEFVVRLPLQIPPELIPPGDG